MNGRTRWLITAGLLAAGCQAPPAEPSVAPPSVVPTPVSPPATQAQTPATQTESRADAAARLAEQQAKSIQELLDARNAAAAGIPVLEPGRSPVVAPPAVPKAVDPPPATKAVAAAAEAFRPVPPIGSANAAVDAPTVDSSSANASPANSSPAVAPASPALATASSTPVPDAASLAAAAAGPLDQRLAQAARERPRDLAPQLDEQLLRFVRGDPVPSAEAVAGLNTEDRDILTSLLDGLSNFRTGIRQDANLLLPKKIRPLVEMADRLRARADLSVVNAALCRSVAGFGNYVPIAPLRLTRGVNYKPKIYYEIENVSPRLDGNNMWATVMRQDVVLYDEAGRMKWNWPNVPVTDLCRNRRKDFFYARAIELPTNLEPGAYTLKITVSDLAAGRVSETSLAITIVPAIGATPGKPVGPPPNVLPQ